MSKQKFKKFIHVLCVSFVGLMTLVAVKHASTQYTDTSKASEGAQQTQRSQRRNLSLQPEAFNLARRLGARFLPDKPQRSQMLGTIRSGSESQAFQVIREQKGDGEQVEISLDQSGGLLRWDAMNGATSAGTRASSRDRELIEKLVFDSADQFVLAQLRGAAYSTIARQVRPDDAIDGYDGPLWDVIRIQDSADEGKRAESPWRLYYLNTRTGLIDRIVSEIRGERLIAEISQWGNNDGETFPTQINWRRDQQVVMQLNVTQFSIGPAQ